MFGGADDDDISCSKMYIENSSESNVTIMMEDRLSAGNGTTKAEPRLCGPRGFR